MGLCCVVDSMNKAMDELTYKSTNGENMEM
jgi:hypothetical protein